MRAKRWGCRARERQAARRSRRARGDLCRGPPTRQRRARAGWRWGVDVAGGAWVVVGVAAGVPMASEGAKASERAVRDREIVAARAAAAGADTRYDCRGTACSAATAAAK